MFLLSVVISCWSFLSNGVCDSQILPPSPLARLLVLPLFRSCLYCYFCDSYFSRLLGILALTVFYTHFYIHAPWATQAVSVDITGFLQFCWSLCYIQLCFPQWSQLAIKRSIFDGGVVTTFICRSKDKIEDVRNYSSLAIDCLLRSMTSYPGKLPRSPWSRHDLPPVE